MDAFPVHEDQHRQMIFRIAIFGKSKKSRTRVLENQNQQNVFSRTREREWNKKNRTTELISKIIDKVPELFHKRNSAFL